MIKQNLVDQFLQNWNSQLDNSSKRRNYNLFKSDIKCEKYLTTLNGSLLYTMFRFRIANHKLPIETGSWNNIELSESKCQLCESNNLGDESRYLLECSFFRNERQLYIDQYFYRRSNTIQFKELLQNPDAGKMRRLSKFMKIIMQKIR